MPIQAVIWDFGGVLVRTEDQSPRLRLAEKYQVSPQTLYDLVFNSPSAFQASVGELQAAHHWENVLHGLKLPSQEMQVLQEGFWAGDILDTRLIDYIRSLRPRYKIGLLSNAFSDLRQSLAQRYPIQDVFDDLVISAEVKMRKPDLRIYRLAVERLGVPAPNAVFVDDFIENIEAARQAGLKTVYFKTPGQAKAELNRLFQEAS